MRESRSPRKFVRRSHVIPKIDGHHRQPVVLRKNHFQSVVQFVLFKFQLRHFERPGLRCRRLRGRLPGRLRRRLSLCTIRKNQKCQHTWPQDILVEFLHHRFLSDGRKLTVSRQTALADVPKTLGDSLPCSTPSASFLGLLSAHIPLAALFPARLPLSLSEICTSGNFGRFARSSQNSYTVSTGLAAYFYRHISRTPPCVRSFRVCFRPENHCKSEIT